MWGFRRRRRLAIREGYEQLPQGEWTDDEMDHWWMHLSDEAYWSHWETWSREAGEHPRVKRIRADCLAMAREAARETDAPDAPREFACLLSVREGTIDELVLLPGTVSGDEHAIFDFTMAPVDASVRGTLHSHPDTHPYPSDADFELFSKEGEIHIILCRPYGPTDWRAYSHDGHPVRLEVVG